MMFRRLTKLSAAVALTLLIFSCNSEKTVFISGNYPDGAGETLKLEMLNISQLSKIDSVKIDKKGRFKAKFSLESPELISLRNKEDQTVNLLLYPGDKVTLDVHCSDFSTCYSVLGSEESEDIRSLVFTASETISVLNSIVEVLNQSEDSVHRQSLVEEYLEIYQVQRKANIKFIVENVSSLASIYAVYQRLGPDQYILGEVKDLQFLKIIADSVGVKYPNSTLVQSLLQDVNNRQEAYNNQLLMSKLAEKGISGTGNIELSIPDAEGNEVSIRSLEGKVVLLNFWASTNAASRQSNLGLKSIYEKYHSRGFEVYSVSLDNSKSAWMDAVRFEDYKWINVCELTYPESYAASVYNITQIPSSFLIDREGNIVAKDLSSRELGIWLDNLL